MSTSLVSGALALAVVSSLAIAHPLAGSDSVTILPTDLVGATVTVAHDAIWEWHPTGVSAFVPARPTRSAPASTPALAPTPASTRPRADIIRWEDGSWRDQATGETGCTPGALCDDTALAPTPASTRPRADIIRWEDGSWRDQATGETGCTPGALCDDTAPAPVTEAVPQ